MKYLYFFTLKPTSTVPLSGDARRKCVLAQPSLLDPLHALRHCAQIILFNDTVRSL